LLLTKEHTIAYVESHDQALVGDKTVAFWLMDKEMYTNMSDLTDRTPTIDRGIALHKMIRFITASMGGWGYLTFIGNEFGHPEWLDFPREGNSDSFQHARRQFNLVDDKNLRYKYLNEFDRGMIKFITDFDVLGQVENTTLKHEGDKAIVFEKVGLVFAFNFNSSKSFTDYRIGVSKLGKYKVIFSTERKVFGGLDRIDESVAHFSEDYKHCNCEYSMKIYLPCRSAIVFQCVE
jgi:1,4-alpha-glucan branching enzyme